MANNLIRLRGYLLVEQVQYEQGTPTLTGWIYTGFPAGGDRHPFVASGRPADVILAHTYHLGNRQDRVPRSLHWVVVINGKLISQGRRAFVEIKLANFFDVSDPITTAPSSSTPVGVDCPSRPEDLAVQRLLEKRSIVVNDVEMQGYLHLGNTALQLVTVGERQIETITACLATDDRSLGGSHQLLMGSDLASGIIDRFGGEARLHDSGVQASVFGKLVSSGYRVYVLANMVSVIAPSPAEKTPVYQSA